MTTLIRPSHGRIDYYDGVRAVAIGAVLLVHWAARYTPYFDGGYIGVDVFFVLSGFLITSLLWQRRDDRVPMSQAYLRFIRARILRLYPALVGLLVIGTCIVGLMGEPVSFPEAARNAGISMGQGATWVYALDLGSTEPFGQTWSLGVEWTFYLVWPWLIYLWRRRGTSARTAGWCSAGLAVVAYVTALPTSAIWFYFAPAPRFSEILAGCAIGLLLQDAGGRSRPSRPWAELLGWASLALIALWTVVGPGQYTSAYRYVGFPLVTLASVGLCVLPSWAHHTVVERVLRLRPLVLIGLASYSLYLWHLIALQTLTPGRFGLPFIALGLVGILFTGAATYLSYRLLEAPRFGRSSRGPSPSGLRKARSRRRASSSQQGRRRAPGRTSSPGRRRRSPSTTPPTHRRSTARGAPRP